MGTQEPASEKPKIIVDEDWKTRVERERAELEKGDKADPESPQPRATQEIPPASFEFLTSTLFTQAMMALGQMPNPVDGEAKVELELARHHIDMLGVLQEKTQGNLTAQESKMMDEVLHTLRIVFVNVQTELKRKSD